jgi:hypothetical protein
MLGSNTIKYTRVQQPSSPNAKLRDISDWYAAGTVPPSWDAEDALPLWINPQRIDWGVSAVWGSQSGHLSTNENLQYGFSKRESIEIPDILVWTDDRNRDVTPYLDRLESLTKPGTNSYPPILALIWGNRVLQPIVLTQVSIIEDSWANGLCSSATVNLSFLYTKAPKYRLNADQRRLDALSEREQAKVQKDAQEKLGLVKDAQGKLKITNSTSNVPNPDQGKPITVNSKGEVIQGGVLVAKYTKKDANGSFDRGSFQKVKVPDPKPQKP